MSPKTSVKFILGTHLVGDSTKNAVTTFDNLEDIQALLDAFHSRGYEHLDTARDYSLDAPGSSEQRLGQAGATSRFTVHTKVHSGTPGDHEPAKVDLSIESSLNDLKTDSVETMFLHVPDRQTPFEDAIKTMHEAAQKGKFKKFGLSNYAPWEVNEILEICEKKGYTKPSVYQGHYNAVVRGGEKEFFPLLRKHNMAFWAYSPAAGGLFSGHVDTSVRWSKDNTSGQLYGSIYGHPPIQASIDTIREAAEKHAISGHAAAIRWAAFHSILDGEYGDGIVFGVSKLEQLHQTLDALESGPLPAEVADAISAIYATIESVEGAEPFFHL